MNIVAVIPAHNEVNTIGKIARLALKYVSKVIVVDDCSSDDTYRSANYESLTMVPSKKHILVLHNYYNLGYDGTLNTGFEAAVSFKKTRIILTIDGDGEHDPDDIPRVLEPIISGRADIVCGERLGYSHFSEAIFAFYTGVRFGISDPLCGFKAYRREVYDSVGYFDRTNSIGTELMLRGARKGYRVANVKIRLHPRQDSSRFYNGLLRGNLRILRAMARGFALL